MSGSEFDAGPFPVTVHPYPSPTRGSCAYELGGGQASTNALIFIDGLGGGPHMTAYIRTVAEKLKSAADLSYSVFEIRMTSSFSGFGAASLKTDVADISSLVKYLRSIGKDKIVLLGHSTGCQDAVEYANAAKYHNPPVDGYILQAPVSDRQGVGCVDLPPGSIEEAAALAEAMISEGRADDYIPRNMLPPVYDAPMTAYRFNSLLSKGGDDDFFSSDLDQDTVKSIWGRFDKPVLILHSGKDEYVPPEIDQTDLTRSWAACTKFISPLSAVVPGASHAPKDLEAQNWVAERIALFLGRL